MKLFNFVNRSYRSILFKLFLISNLVFVLFLWICVNERFHASGYEMIIAIPFMVIVLGMIVFKRIEDNATLWVIITVITAFLVLSNWHSIMNFNYLVVYCNLCVALLLIWDKPNFLEQIARYGKYSLALIFLCAAIQKLTSPVFMSGEYFYHSWFNSPVLSSFLTNFGVTNQMDVCAHHWQELMHGFGSAATTFETKLPNNDNLRFAGQIMAYMAVSIEVLIATFFFLPSKNKYAKYKHFFLITFLVIAYFIIPMIGYVVIFLAMAFSQVQSSKKLPTYYLITGILVLALSLFRIQQISDFAKLMVIGEF